MVVHIFLFESIVNGAIVTKSNFSQDKRSVLILNECVHAGNRTSLSSWETLIDLFVSFCWKLFQQIRLLQDNPGIPNKFLPLIYGDLSTQH